MTGYQALILAQHACVELKIVDLKLHFSIRHGRLSPEIRKHLSGAKADRARWKKCVSFADADLGEALGREFVRRTLGGDGQLRTSAMVEAFERSIKHDLETITSSKGWKWILRLARMRDSLCPEGSLRRSLLTRVFQSRNSSS